MRANQLVDYVGGACGVRADSRLARLVAYIWAGSNSSSRFSACLCELLSLALLCDADKSRGILVTLIR